MKIAVFGSTGKTGMQVVSQALDAGYEVNAFVRDPKKMTIKHKNLTVTKGDVLVRESVDKAIKGAGAVMVALGSRPDTKPTVLAEGTANIISSIKTHKVNRLIVQSSYALSGSPEGMARLKAQGMDEEKMKMVKPMIVDKINQERKVRESGLDYVIVRPLALTDGKRTGKYRVGEKLQVEFESKVSRADVADFMLKSLKDDKWIGKTVVLSY